MAKTVTLKSGEWLALSMIHFITELTLGAKSVGATNTFHPKGENVVS